MATVGPVKDDKAKTPIYQWVGVATGDTLLALDMAGIGGVVSSVQISGTHGGATNKLQVSNDGAVWFDLNDKDGNAVSATANAFFELNTAARYIRPAVSGGTGDSVTYTLRLGA